MRFLGVRGMPALVVVCLGVSVASARAQQPQQAAAAQAPQGARADQSAEGEQRYVISVLERALEQAVLQGGRLTSQRASIVPQELLWFGEIRARGFRLDDYGVLFNVEVPSISNSFRSLVQVVDQNDARMFELMMQQLRQEIASLPDRQSRDRMAATVKQIEESTRKSPGRVPVPTAPRVNPNEQYEEDVKNQLTDAMLRYSDGLNLGPNEWLTIAARGSEAAGPMAGGGDPVTVFLRVKGADLTAYRTGKLTWEEVRKRVEVKEH